MSAPKLKHGAMISFSRLGNLGQLGNQLFQVAATSAAARRFGTPAKFPPWRYAEYFTGPFDLSLEPAEIKETYVEPQAAYKPIPPINDLDLFGFFQSERYFRDQEEIIRGLFSFKDDLLPDSWRDIEADCAIHVRGGDYQTLAHVFVPLGWEYYERAIKLMRDRGCSRFLVFSNDIDWCRKNFSKEYTIVEGLSDIQSLCLMSRCRNHIIANSTFSWWGSWLCDYPDKMIVAPQTWYSFCYSTRKDDSYQFCTNWQTIPNPIRLGHQIWSLIRSGNKKHFINSYIDRTAWLQEEYRLHAERGLGTI